MSDPVAVTREAAVVHLSAEALDALDNALGEARRSPARAAKAFKATAKQLGQGEAAARLLAWGAEALRAAQNQKNASALFKLARAAERKAGAVDEPARFARFAAFLDERMLELPAITAYIGELKRSKAAALAEPLLKALVGWARGREVEHKLLGAVDKYAKAIKDKGLGQRLFSRLLGEVEGLESETWAAHHDAAVAALREDEALARWALGLFNGGPALRRILLESDAVDLVAGDPEEASRWLYDAIAAHHAYEPDVEPFFEALVPRLAPGARGAGRPITLSYASGADARVVDILVEHGVPVVLEEGYAMQLCPWSRRSPRRPLVHLQEIPALRDRLLESYDRSNHLDSDSTLRDAALAAEGVRWIFEKKAEGFAAELEGATLARLDLINERLSAFATAEHLAAVPRLRRLVRELDVADLLARTLRYGVLDELCWPALDAANDALAKDAPQYATDGPFPCWAMCDAEARRVVVLGPEGIVHEAPLPEGFPDQPRAMRYIKGDVLYFFLNSSLRPAYWLSDPQPFDATLYDTWTCGAPTPQGAVWDAGRTITPGSTDIRPWIDGPFFSDGARFWAGRRRVDPDAREVVEEGLPEWLAAFEVEGAELDLEACFYWPAPAGRDGSPLGGVGAQAGVRVRREADGDYSLETLDGRAWRGQTSHFTPRALLRFPGRDEDCLFVEAHGDKGVWLGDGSHPLVPPQHAAFHRYWNGAPQWLPLPWWHYLVPRDPRGSEALAACTLAQARALLEAARGGAKVDGTTTMSDGAVTATLTITPRNASALDAHPEIAAAVEAAFPEITAWRLAAGVTCLTAHAAELDAKVAQWRAMADAAEVEGEAQAALTDDDVRAIEPHAWDGWFWAKDSFERSIRDAARFLAAPDDALPFKALTSSKLAWEALLPWSGAILKALMSPMTDDRDRAQLRAALELWAQTEFAADPARYRVLGLRLDEVPQGVTHETGDFGVVRDNAYALRSRGWSPGDYRFVALERAGADGFIDPDWAEILWIREGEEGLDAAAIEDGLAAFDAHGPLRWDPRVGGVISAATGLLPSTAALWWLEALEPDAALREALKLKKADVTLAAAELPRGRSPLNAASIPTPPSALYAPLEPDASGVTPAARMADAWVTLHGRKRPLDVPLMRLLEDHFHQKDHPFHLDMTALMDPEAQGFLTQDVDWIIRPWRGFQSNVSYMRGSIPAGWPMHADRPAEGNPDIERAFSGWVLRRLLRYVPWAHQELPGGHPMRAGVARLCALIRQRLEHPELLLLGGAVDLSVEEDSKSLERAFEGLISRFEGAPYAPECEAATAEGLDRGDVVVTWPRDLKNSIFIAFRPSRIEEPEALARLAEDLGFREVFQRSGGGCSCGLNFGNHTVVDFTELPPWLVWRAEGFQRLVAHLSGDLEGGAFEADPRASAPALVEEVMAARALSREAATLYLQILTLAEPEPARLMRLNGWKRGGLKKAEAELLTQGLVEARSHAGLKRAIYLPGDMIFPKAPGRPLEAQKAALYGLEGDEPAAPFGVILPLRPLPELFSSAWEAARPLDAERR